MVQQNNIKFTKCGNFFEKQGLQIQQFTRYFCVSNKKIIVQLKAPLLTPADFGVSTPC
jgi:hypothetical protein